MEGFYRGCLTLGGFTGLLSKELKLGYDDMGTL